MTRTAVPFFTNYAADSDIGCGHQHRTLEAATNCAIHLACAHPGVEYMLYEWTPGEEPTREYLGSWEAPKAGINPQEVMTGDEPTPDHTLPMEAS